MRASRSIRRSDRNPWRNCGRCCSDPKPASGIAAWTAAARTSPARWLIGATASVFLVACAYGGWEYRRAWADASAQAGGVEVAQSVAPARDEEKQAQARADAEAKRREEAELAEKKTAEDRARQEAEAKRQAEAAKPEADKAAKGAFDGEWEVVGQGGTLCRFKDWKYRISIENNRILVPKMPPGEVKPSGEFQYKYVAVGLPGAAPGRVHGLACGRRRQRPVQLFQHLPRLHDAQSSLATSPGTTVMPAPRASDANERDQAGTQSTLPSVPSIRAWIPAFLRERPDGRSRCRDDEQSQRRPQPPNSFCTVVRSRSTLAFMSALLR